MANQTITSDSNHDDVTGRSAGENITIQSGATLTIDSMPQHTTLGIIGLIDLDDGTVVVDARQCKRLVYDGGSGTIPAVGDVVTNGTQTGTAKIIELLSGNNVSGEFTVTLLTGTFDDNDTLSTSGGWAGAVDQATLEVGYMTVIFEGGEFWSGNGLSSIEFRGASEKYIAGIGDGTDNQSITLPHSGVQVGCWVETGDGTDVYEPWYRKHPDAAFNLYGTGSLGRVFNQAVYSSTMTFGTSTDGDVPPNGARILIPNLHIASATTGSPTTEISTHSSHGGISIRQQMPLIADYTTFSSFSIRMSGYKSISATDSLFRQYSTYMVATNNEAIEFTGCFLAGSDEWESLGNSWVRIVDVVGEATFTDCVFPVSPHNSLPCIVAETSDNITFVRPIVRKAESDNIFSQAGFNIDQSSNVTITAPDVIAGGVVRAISASNLTVTDAVHACSPRENNTTSASRAYYAFDSCNNLLFDGYTLVGQAPNNDFMSFTDSSNITVRNFGTAASPIDLSTTGATSDSPLLLDGVIIGVKIHNVHVTGAAGNFFYEPSSILVGRDIEFVNCTGPYNKEYEAVGSDMLIKGCRAGSGGFNSSTGIEVDFTKCNGSNFGDVYTSATEGNVFCLFMDPDQYTDSNVSVTSGTPGFNGLGDVLMRTIGDQIELTFPYNVQAHTAFQNTTPVLSGTSTSNLDVEYAIDTGSGFGAYKDATGANLSGETLDVTGTGIKIRVTANSTSTSTSLNGLGLLTNTTVASQLANPYNTDEQGILIINVLDSSTLAPIPNATVYILADSSVSGNLTDNEVLFSGFSNASGVVNLSVGLTANQPIDGVARKGSASPLYKSSSIISSISPGLTNEINVLMISDE